MASTQLLVIIIGAGSTGLLLAQGLKQKGVRAVVYEREDSTTYQTRPREWGMTLHWGASHISTCIPPELRSKLNENICTDPYHAGKDLSLPHFNGQTGEKLLDSPGAEPRRISRKKLRNFLSQGIDVQYGKKLESIELADEDEVVARFTDGSSVTGSCLIGCDGAHSIVRTCLVGDEVGELQDLDIQMFNISCKFPRDISLLQRNFGHPVFKNSYHPDGLMWWQSVQNIEDPDRPESWLWQNILSWRGPPRAVDFPDQASRLAFWRKQGEKFADPWRSVAKALSGDLEFGVDKTTVWTPIDWSTSPLASKVTLAGDAAHCMPAHRGQGLNNALEDAANLVEQLDAVQKGKALSESIREYENEMRERVKTEIPISIMQATMVHDFEQLMEAPMFKMGMHKYREAQAQAQVHGDKEVEKDGLQP